ncbi:MAG: hypothetical protein QXP42_02170 [Candidatus Micrarchaeia archaeon]
MADVDKPEGIRKIEEVLKSKEDILRALDDVEQMIEEYAKLGDADETKVFGWREEVKKLREQALIYSEGIQRKQDVQPQCKKEEQKTQPPGSQTVQNRLENERSKAVAAILEAIRRIRTISPNSELQADVKNDALERLNRMRDKINSSSSARELEELLGEVRKLLIDYEDRFRRVGVSIDFSDIIGEIDRIKDNIRMEIGAIGIQNTLTQIAMFINRDLLDRIEQREREDEFKRVNSDVV